MGDLKGEIKDALVGYQGLHRIGQQKLAAKLGIGAEAVNDLIHMKRLPKDKELEKLDRFFNKGWVSRMVEQKRAGRRRRDERGGRIHRVRTANGSDRATVFTLGQYAKLDDGKANG